MIRIGSLSFSRCRDDSGSTMVEYALILLSILIVVVVGAALVGAASNGNYVDVDGCLNAGVNC